MEIGEQPPLRLLDEALHARRNAEPLELARHQLVARHHRLHALRPVSAGQRASAGLFRFEPAMANHGKTISMLVVVLVGCHTTSHSLGWVLVGFVVGSGHRIIGNVNMYNFAALQLVLRQLVDLRMARSWCQSNLSYLKRVYIDLLR